MTNDNFYYSSSFKRLIGFMESKEQCEINLVQINFNVPVEMELIKYNFVEVKYEIKETKQIDSSFFTKLQFKLLTEKEG